MAERPYIEPGVPDQHGTPGFYLYIPMLSVDRFRDELRELVPADDIAWSAMPPAWWIADLHRERVEALVERIYGPITRSDAA